MSVTASKPDVLRRLHKRRLVVRHERLDDITSALVDSPSPRLPDSVVAAFQAEGRLFLSSYAGAAPLMNMASPDKSEARHDEAAEAVTQESTASPPLQPSTSDAGGSSSSSTPAEVFAHFVCSSGAPADMLSTVGTEQHWIRQVVSLLNPPPLEAHRDASVEVVSCQEGKETAGVCQHDGATGAGLCCVAHPVRTVTAVLAQNKLRSFRPTHDAADGSAELDEAQLWESHVVAVQAAEQHFRTALCTTTNTLLASATPPHPDPTAAAAACSLSVPIYHTTLFALDTAATRIAALGSFTNRVIGLMVRPDTPEGSSDGLGAANVSRLVRVNTCAMRVLVLCSQRLAQGHDAAVCRVLKTLLDVLDDRSNAGADAGIWCATMGHDLLSCHGGDENVSGAFTRALCRPPSVLVHCLQGVSRSPSVVLYYIMVRWAEEEAAEQSKVSVEAPSVDVPVFADLVELVRRARPCVKPNLCFSIELATTWRRLTSSS